MKKVSRRGLLKDAGVLLLGTAAGGLGLSAASSPAQASTDKSDATKLPYPYTKLDPAKVAERAYDAYLKGACCYGVFSSIIDELKEKMGAPYTNIPTAMMIFGEGGIGGVGSTCGTLNGAAAAIFLIAGEVEKEKREPAFAMIRELFNWYSDTPLPDVKPSKAKFDIPKSVSRSNLCHVSVSKWCKASNRKSQSNERKERCGWLVASVAKRTVEILNAHHDGQFKMVHELSAETQSCRGCHDKGSDLENTRGMMDCGGCHFTLKAEHPGGILKKGG